MTPTQSPSPRHHNAHAWIIRCEPPVWQLGRGQGERKTLVWNVNICQKQSERPGSSTGDRKGEVTLTKWDCAYGPLLHLVCVSTSTLTESLVPAHTQYKLPESANPNIISCTCTHKILTRIRNPGRNQKFNFWWII